MTANDKLFIVMDPRTELILQKSVKDFIDTGRPITSEYLYENYNFGIKPAMIRRELSILDEEGYLEQIHTSGGRFPTNKAYQYFVEKVLKKEKEKEVRKRIRSKTNDVIEHLLSGNLNRFIENLSQQLSSLGVLYEVEERNIYDSGLEPLFRGIKWSSRDEMIDLIRDIEAISKRLEEDDWWKEKDNWPKVFIGKNPIIKNDHVSVLANKLIINGENEFILVTVGPKRMDYEKTFKVLKQLEDMINLNE